MEPNKFDNEIREKLSQRTIEPTPMAWDRLDAMLSVAEQAPKKKPNRTWMYMAACFLALLLAGTFFLNQSSDNGDGVIEGNGNQVVTKGHTQGQKGQQLPGNASGNNNLENNNTMPGAVAGTGSSSSSKNNQKQQHNAVVLATPFHPLPPEYIAQQAAANQHKISVDATALLAEVSTPKINTAKAMQPKVSVDANALLSGIEGDMETNFRERMLDRLAKNYNEVKDAVATRNYN